MHSVLNVCLAINWPITCVVLHAQTIATTIVARNRTVAGLLAHESAVSELQFLYLGFELQARRALVPNCYLLRQ